MITLRDGRTHGHAGSMVALALILTVAGVVGLFLLITPFVLLLIVGGACAAAVIVFLLHQPRVALHLAIILYLFPFGLRPLEVSIMFDIIANGALALALCAWLLNAPFQRQPIRWNTECVLLALFIFWASVTLLWAADLVEGRRTLVQFAMGFIMLFLIVQQIRTILDIDAIMRDLAMVGWTVVIAGLLTLLFAGYHSGGRLKVGDLNENALGVLLILMLAGVIWPVLRSTGRKRLFYMALSVGYILATVVLVLLSGSRGSTISLAVMLLAFWFWKPLRPWAKMGSGMAASALVVAPFLLTSLANRSSENTGNELGSRDILWTAAWHLIQDYPLTGAGLGNGRFRLTPYIAALTPDYGERPDLPCHNPFLEVGCDTGFIGMLLYASILVIALRNFLRTRARYDMRDGALAAYFPLVLVCTISYLSSFIKSGGYENHPTFFLLLALLIIPTQLSNARTLGAPGRLAKFPVSRPVPPLRL